MNTRGWRVPIIAKHNPLISQYFCHIAKTAGYVAN